ncbi:hypothetical protein D3C75_1272740 [compost metagenome]
MAPVAITFFVLMIGFCIALAMQSSEPTPEYIRIMAEHNARMAAFEADKPMRMAQYILDSEERREKMRKEWADRSAARRAELLAQGE